MTDNHDTTPTGADDDARITAAITRIDQALERLLDLDAGLAAIHATAHTPEPPAPPRPQPRPVATPHLQVMEEDGQPIAWISAQLAGLLAELAPAAVPPGAGVGRGSLYLATVHQLLDQLRHGLLTRTLDRATAERLLRLADHNITEAAALLGEDRTRTGAGDPARRLAAWTQIAHRIRIGLEDLAPRVRRLFDEADTPSPAPTRPRQPV